ncbi:MAG: hypothetical protein HYS86_02115 [Candidatus Chisholmbacteria bacterium]|nr:hypothetical protein [Candidatus Chisholmbacteria bacterium]
MGALPKRKISTHRKGRRRRAFKNIVLTKLKARLDKVAHIERKSRYLANSSN